jgi:hypothetical protein
LKTAAAVRLEWLRMAAPRRVLRGWQLGALLLVAWPEHPALARDPPDARAANARAQGCGGAGPTLDVVLVGALAQHGLEAAICDWFRDEPWRVRFSNEAAMTERSAGALRVVVRLPSAEQARLDVDGPAGRAWVHHVPFAAGLDEAGVEVLAQTLHSMVQAAAMPPSPARRGDDDARVPGASGRLGGGHAGVPSSRAATAGHASQPVALADDATPRTAAAPEADSAARAASTATAASTPTPEVPASPQPAAAPVRPSPTPRPPGRPLPVHTGVGYQAYLRGEEPPAHGPALRFALDWLPREPTLGSFVRLALLGASQQEVQGLSVDSSALSLSAGVHGSVSRGRVSGRAALGGGVDLIALDVGVLDPERLRLLPDRRARPRPFLLTEAGVVWRAGPLELGLSALLRWQLLATRFQIRDGERSVRLFAPWRLQPGMALDVAYLW